MVAMAEPRPRQSFSACENTGCEQLLLAPIMNSSGKDFRHIPGFPLTSLRAVPGAQVHWPCKAHKRKKMAKAKTDSGVIKAKYSAGSPGHVLRADYFYYDTAPNFKKNLAIVCGGRERCAPDFDINRSNYPFNFIKYTVRGKGTLTSNAMTFPLQPGTLSGFSAGVPHHYKAAPEEPMEHIFLTFLGSESKDLMQKSGLRKGGAIAVHDPAETLALFETILRVGMVKQPFSQTICCHYLRILLLRQAAGELALKSHSVSVTTFNKCKNYIDRHFSENICMSDVAEDCDINVKYMSSLFKRYSDNTPYEYLMKIKLNKAADMLLNTSLTVKNIGEQIGLMDPYHFSRMFKQYYGLSPKHYRQKHG
jgi:AraC-like DNA-binding protein